MSRTVNELIEYTESDRVMYRQLESGEWEWVFDVWNGETNEYDEVLKGTSPKAQHAVIDAHTEALSWAMQRLSGTAR